jgi:signal transduction histidine kinase
MFRNSLKIRLAFSYALLFFISCLIIIFFCFYLAQNLLNHVCDAGLERIAGRTTEIYLLGKRINHFNEILHGSHFPETEQKKLETLFPGTRILFSACNLNIHTKNRRQPRSYHTAIVLQNDEYYEIRFSSNGELYRKKLYPEHNKNALRSYFSQLLLNRGKENFAISVFEKNNQVYLESHPGAIPREILQKMLYSKNKQNIRKFRYALFPLAGGRKMVIAIHLNRRISYLTNIRSIGAILLGCMTAAGAVIAGLLTRRFIRGIKEMTLAMNRTRSGDYSYRLQEYSDYDPEIRDLTATFNAMNERTENLLKELRTVSDNVAHDLRTPLTRISGTVELMLNNKDLPEEIRNGCVSIAEEIADLKELINTIMEISRTNAAPETFQWSEFDLAAVTADFCEFMAVAFEEKSLDFHVSIPEEEIPLCGDKRMFQRLLSNLLGNALKFTEKGFVSLKVEKDHSSVRLQVSDSGCGIPPEDQAKVFKRFFRSDASRHLQGNGLGLALVKAIVKAHKWQITLHSVPGEGSTFTVILPGTAADPIRKEC